MTDTAIRPTSTPSAQPNSVCGGAPLGQELGLNAMRARLAQLNGASNSAQRAMVAAEVLSSNPSHVMDVLACTTSPELDRVLASAFGSEAAHMRTAIGAAVSHMFRKEMVEHIATRMHDTAQQLRIISSEPQLSRWAADVARNSPDALARVAALADFGVDTQSILRVAHAGGSAGLREALRDAAAQASNLIATSARGMENGQYDIDLEGAIYENFPGSTTHVAHEHGAPHSDALRAHHDASALGAFIADDRTERESTARLHHGIEGVINAGLSIGVSLGLSEGAAAVVNLARSALAFGTTVRAAYAHADEMQVAAGFHLNTQTAADEALLEARAQRIEAGMAPLVGLIPGGAGHGTGHVVAHATEHLILHDGPGIGLRVTEHWRRP